MINISNKTQCSGCGACMQICPVSAISMQVDEEGFLYPKIDNKKCVKCGLCIKICPILNKKVEQNKQETPIVYASKNKDEDIQNKSSSGGMFSIIADYILEQKGVVFGAGFNDTWEVVHKFIENKEDLDLLRKSKYVQSNTLSTFKETKKFLESGRKVLYCGTPCQIAGLKSFLGKDYDNLIMVCVICHGVPSPKVWEKFLRENFNLSEIKNIDFRDKKYGWSCFFDNFILKNKMYKDKIQFFISKNKIKKLNSYLISHYLYSPYLKGFLCNLFLRPSCYKCSFRGNYKSDFLLADAWGYYDYVPEMFDKKGLSVIFINTEKAQKIFDDIKEKMIYKQVSFDKVIKYNPCYKTSVKPHKKREEFFARYQKENINKLVKELTYRPLFIKVLGKIKGICKKIMKI